MPWTLGGVPIRLQDDWAANCSAGGYDQFRGTCTEADFRRVPGATQGTAIAGYTSDGTCIYYGFVSSPPQITGGVAKLVGQGAQYKARKKTDRLLVRSDDLSQWGTVDSDPLSGGDRYRKIAVSGDKRLEFRINGGDALVAASGNRNGFAFWAEGVNLKQVKFTMDYDSNDDDSNLELQTARVDGPTLGGANTVDSYTCSTANRGATKTSTFANPNDTALLYLHVKTDETPSGAQHYLAKNISVYSDINLTDSYSAWKVLEYIGGQLGWDTSGVTSSTFNVLPFDHTDDWGTNADYVCELEDRWWRVLDDRGSGPYLESNLWSASTNWTVSSTTATPTLTPLELFDKVIVHYYTPSGVTRQKSATTTAISVGRAFETTLEDRQGDATLAGNVASALLARYSTQRYQGTIEVRGLDNPYLIRHGDTITISDWDVGANIMLRVEDAQYSAKGVTVGVEQPVNLSAIVAWIARHDPRRHRRR